MTLNVIRQFREENDFLSNFFLREIVVEDLLFASSEHAYHALKTLILEERFPFLVPSSLTESQKAWMEEHAIHSFVTPGQSKRGGKKVTLRPNWNHGIDLLVMHHVVTAKFTQHEDLKTRLLATGDSLLIEGNSHGDIYWGQDLLTGEGHNHLGKTLMRVRKELLICGIIASGKAMEG